MSAIREGIDGLSRSRRGTSRPSGRRRFGGLVDLLLVVMVAFAMGTRTPVGGLTGYAIEKVRGHDTTLPSLTAYFSGGAAPTPAVDIPLLLPQSDLETPADAIPEPWRTAFRTVLADEKIAAALEAQLATREDLPETDRILAALDAAYVQTRDPEAALGVLALGHAQRDRAIARATAAGDAHPSRYRVHRRYLPATSTHQADTIVTGTMALATALNLHWPIEIPHRVTSNWGPRIHPVLKKKLFHNGVDLSVPIGTPLYAAQAGEVVVVGADDRSGKYVVIDHGHGVRTSYCHLDKIPVEKGTVLEKGQEFAESGNTGRSTGPHLHFVVRIAGNTVDPLRFRPPSPADE